MVYVKVYILIYIVAEEFKRFHYHLLRKYGRTDLGVEFLNQPLTVVDQFIHLEYKFHDCTISRWLKSHRIAWSYRISA